MDMMAIRRRVLMASRKKEEGLPDAYQRVESIRGTGEQYIDSGIECTSDLVVDFSFKTTDTTNLAICGGIDTRQSPKLFRHHCTPLHLGTGIGYWIRSYNKTANNPDITKSVVNGAVTNAMIDPVRGIAVVNGESLTFTALPSGATTTKPYGIFARISDKGALQSKAVTFYYFKFYRNGELIGDFVPCYRKSDGEIGMYDLVGKQFHTNAGTGTFSKGNDVN